MIKNQPESLAAVQARYPECLKQLFVMSEIIEGATRPGQCPANVFDFEDGLRLIISRDRLLNKVRLHVSASFGRNCTLSAETARRVRECGSVDTAIREWIDTIPQRFRELSGDMRPLKFIGRTASGIPHWFIEEEQ